jgi:hypothetical protein
VPPVTEPPPWVEPKYMSTLIAMTAYVTTGCAWTLRIVRTLVFWREHSGQRIPTGVAVMQSGQIGRSQFEHATPVSRPWWR